MTNERSLEKIPEITPGPLVRGSMSTLSGTFINLAGVALERITRERTEVPPEFQLPESPVYFLDPSTNRMVMISNRVRVDEPVWRSGLFAEIVELDDKGKPRFQLSTKEVLLPDENFVPVVVGPNEFNMPPSHIEMTEVEESGEEKFAPWNVYLGSLQSWMNEVSIEEGETFEAFMNRFISLRQRSQKEAEGKIKKAFPGGVQGFAETTAPFNYIISDEVNREQLERASREAGLYPAFINVKDLLLIEAKRQTNPIAINSRQDRNYQMLFYMPHTWGADTMLYHPTVITDDWTALFRLEEQDPEFVKQTGSLSYTKQNLLEKLMKYNPIFNYVRLTKPLVKFPWEETVVSGVRKEANGKYQVYQDEQTYREFLYKIKADLLLTMFVRGKAPLTK